MNLTQLIKNFPELNYQYFPIRDIPVRDVSYLPEEYYDTEKMVREMVQLRDNRNLMPVSIFYS